MWWKLVLYFLLCILIRLLNFSFPAEMHLQSLVSKNLNNNTGKSRNQYACKKLDQDEISRIFLTDVPEKKYILVPQSGPCGGIGNQLYRYASLYGLARAFRRIPAYFEKYYRTCFIQENIEDEITNIFPVFMKNLIKIKYYDTLDMINVPEFGTHCCNYDDPARFNFHDMNETFIVIGNNFTYLQNHNYFKLRRNDIRKIFTFSSSICTKIRKYGQELFGSNNNEYKLCIHTRRGDFSVLGFGSKKNFTELATHHISNQKKKNHSNVSIILMGEDKEFIEILNFDNTIIYKIYKLNEMSRGEDLAFAALLCDSLLITTTESSFSFWMAYLMPSYSSIYYPADYELNSWHNKNSNQFPMEWIGLKLNDSQILEENGVLI